MTTQTFEFTGEVQLTYNEESTEFQEALADFRGLMDEPDTTADQMLAHVAQNLSEWGDHERMIEGVGYVAVEGLEVPKKHFSGITVAQGFDERHFN
jgi:hypothetical protein